MECLFSFPTLPLAVSLHQGRAILYHQSAEAFVAFHR